MNLQKIFVLAAFVFAAHTTLAQNKISGNITDKQTNEKLTGVSVYISDLKKGTSADKDGNYELSNLKPGKYLLEVSFLGYKTIITQVNITTDATVDFGLEEAHKELSEVVITAVTRATELKRSPVIIKSLDKNGMNQNASTNLIDALKNVPGVSQISTGAAISKPIIRGLGYNRVITLSDGIRQEGQQWGDEHGIEIDEYGVDKVEIVKGPGSLLYGSDGIAGVLNFISPKAPNEGKTKTQLTTNYQSNNNLLGYSVSNAGNKNGFQWLGRFSNKLAGNYQNKYDGKVYNSGFQEYNGSLMLGINKNWGHSYITLSTYNNTLNLVEGDRDSTGNFIYANANGDELTATADDLKGYKIGFPHQEINHVRAASNNYFLLKKGTINADFGVQNNKRKEFADAANPNDKELFFDLTTFNYNVRYNLQQRNDWETSFGIGGMQQGNKNKGLEVLIPEYNLFDLGVFAFTQKTIGENLTFASGLRFDNRAVFSKELLEEGTTNLKFSAFTKNYAGVSGSLGLSYQLDKKSTLKLNLSRGFRAPNIAELASNGRHEGTFRYEIGDPNLKSEISHQLDLAYFLNSDHISFEFTPFVNLISNYIYAQKLTDSLGNDIIFDPADPAPAFKFTQGNATLLGGEVFLDIHPHPLDWLHIENAFSYVQATQNNQTADKKYLPFIPAPKYRGELKAQFQKVNGSISNAYIKFGVDHYFKQDKFFAAYQTETATPAYTLLNAGIGANVKAFNKKDFLSLFISAENLADVAYQSHLSRLKYTPQNLATGRIGVFNMGRNISVEAVVNF